MYPPGAIFHHVSYEHGGSTHSLVCMNVVHLWLPQGAAFISKTILEAVSQGYDENFHVWEIFANVLAATQQLDLTTLL